MRIIRLLATIVTAVISVAVLTTAPAAGSRTAMDAASQLPRIPGTAWVVDPASGQLEVSYDQTVTGAARDRLVSAARRLGDTVRLEPVTGTIRPYISGGEPIFSGQFRCVLGFNVRDGAGNAYFVTAGHCTSAGSTWFADPANTILLGVTVGSQFPGSDFGLVRYTSTVPHPSNVFLQSPGAFAEMTSAGNPGIGQTVCYSSPVSGVRCGTVTAVNATVNFPNGTVSGLIRTNICASPGDSGAPLFSGNTAIGIVSGGTGNCSTGGDTYFQPIVEVLNAFGLTIP
ncbi:MAG: S1 family peptidase [Actinomadura sp.]